MVEPTNTTSMTAPVTPAETPATPAKPTSGLNYANTGKRAVAAIVDQVLAFLVIGFLVGLVTGGTTSDGFSLSGGPAFLAFALMLAYFVGMEGMKGATLGKMFLGLKVVKEDGSPISYQEALIRQVLKLVDGFFFCLVGIIAISKSPIKQRIGDRVAHTVVVTK